MKLTVEFLGLYGAADVASRAQVEWPPHPDRLYQALVDAALPEDRPALAWIEEQGPPDVDCGDSVALHWGRKGKVFVPTNYPSDTLPALRKVAYEPSAFVPVGRVGDAVTGFAVNPSTGIKTFAELIDYAKKNPGKLNYGSAGLGSGAHMRIEMLKYRAGVDITHVPYRGSADALNDLLPGNVQMMNEINVLPHVKAGKLHLLNVNYPKRSPDWPDVPTLTELGLKDADEPVWYALWAPGGVSQPIIDRLNAKVLEIAGTNEMKARMREISVDIPMQKPAEMTEFMKKDSAINADLIKMANVKLE